MLVYGDGLLYTFALALHHICIGVMGTKFGHNGMLQSNLPLDLYISIKVFAFQESCMSGLVICEGCATSLPYSVQPKMWKTIRTSSSHEAPLSQHTQMRVYSSPGSLRRMLYSNESSFRNFPISGKTNKAIICSIPPQYHQSTRTNDDEALAKDCLSLDGPATKVYSL